MDGDNNTNNQQNQSQQPQNQQGAPQSMPMQQYLNRQQQQRGTGFTNIKRILGANEGAGQRIGQQIGSGINEQANAVRQGIQQGQSQFQAGKQQAVNQAQGAINVGNQLARQAGENDIDYSNRVANAQGDLASQGQSLQNAAYTGPQGLQNAGELQAKSATAGALARLGGSAAGQNQLLRNLVAGRGNYSTGQAGLDQLLLGQGGERYVQQARTGASGLEQQAQSNIASAANQANSAQNAIEQNKVAALQNLQNSLSGAGDKTSNNITGLTNIAQQQGQQFNQQAQRLSQILQGVDENGQPIKQLSPDDINLLNNAGNYGLDTSTNLYLKDPNAVQNAINNLARTSLSQGGALYKGKEQQAAQNLATFLGQPDIASQIGANKFDTNAFKTPTEQAFGQLTQQQAYDQQTKDILNQAANTVGSLEQKTISDNASKRDQLVNRIQNYNDPQNPVPQNVKDQLIDNINKQFENSSNQILNKSGLTTDASGRIYKNGQLQSSDYLQQLASSGQYGQFGAAPGIDNPQIQQYAQSLGLTATQGPQGTFVNPGFAQAVQGTAETSGPLGQYASLLYGNKGSLPGDLDQRFQNLGLMDQYNVGDNQYRSSSQLRDAANKVLSQNETLKDYLLNKFRSGTIG